jgi:hypothetical protein
MPDPSPYAVELTDERLTHWNEADVPLTERGVRFSWLCNFVKSFYWERNEPVREQLRLRERARQWNDYARHYPGDLPIPDALKGIQLDGPEPQFYQATIHDFVAEHIIPLTQAIGGPLYARVPPSDRGKPEMFLSHAWNNLVLSPVAQWHGGTLDAFDSSGIAGIKNKFVWIDFACYMQPPDNPKLIAYDMEALIRSIGNVAFAVTMTPLFNRIWCLWEVLSASLTGAETRFCVGPGYRTDRRSMTNKFVDEFKSVKEADATKKDDYDKLLAAMVTRFGSIAAADDHIRKLMHEGMGHPWFELHPESK